MKANPSMQKRLNRTIAVGSLLMLAAGLLVWSPGRGSHAQQDRQLGQTGSTSTNNGKRIALVIGNGAYTNAPPLKNPPNDARDMAATLKTLGFDVTNGINVNQREMKRLIREFGQKLKAGGSGLFYYAGHGVQSKGRNYLIPVDADIQSEIEAEDAGVDVSLVLGYMDDAQNGLNIVILDACRNNPFSRSFRSASEGLAQVDAPTGTLIAYATAPGRVASDGPGQNGLYTSELLKQMRVPGLSVTEMFMRVRAEVIKQTGSKQVPWEASSLVGSFYFSVQLKSAAAPQASPAANETKIDPETDELGYWETIKKNTDGAPKALPRGAEAAMAKGVIAAKQQDYLLAIRYFQEARKAAPGAPELFSNLGLAESKIPGRELRSMAWFGAYLAASPNAPNAAAIKNLLNELDVKSQSNIEHLIKGLEEMATNLPEDHEHGTRDAALESLARVYAIAGDETEAVRVDESDIARRHFDEAGGKVQLAIYYDSYANLLISDEDFPAARAWLSRLEQLDRGLADSSRSHLSESQMLAAKEAEERKNMSTEERVQGWTHWLESSYFARFGALNSGLNMHVFTDVSGYLKSLSEGVQPPGADRFAESGYPRSNNDPVKIFYNTHDILTEVVRVQSKIQRRLKEQLNR